VRARQALEGLPLGEPSTDRRVLIELRNLQKSLGSIDVGNIDHILSSPPDDKGEADRLLEQYKLAVEMWDRTRGRRQISNSFFATINAALVAAIATKDAVPLYSPYVCFSGLVLCALWFFYILTYKKLIDAKQVVIIRMETLLQSKPFSDEKQIVDRGGLPFTQIERGVPIAFALIYALGCFISFFQVFVTCFHF
jgi:hypothetical protein